MFIVQSLINLYSILSWLNTFWTNYKIKFRKKYNGNGNMLFLCPWEFELFQNISLDSDEDTDQWSYEDKPGTSKQERL